VTLRSVGAATAAAEQNAITAMAAMQYAERALVNIDDL
jgi:hypothetical protein